MQAPLAQTPRALISVGLTDLDFSEGATIAQTKGTWALSVSGMWESLLQGRNALYSHRAILLKM